MTKITNVRCIRTRADRTWTAVKVETDQPGLYGLGSASHYFNPQATVDTIEQLYAPLIIGRDPADISDIWQRLYGSGYWRNGSTTNTALAGIDVALWDIKGKEAGLPIYQLLGGRARDAVPCYAHAGGATLDELMADVARYVAEGWPVVRCQLGPYGGGGFRHGAEARGPHRLPTDRASFDDLAYLQAVPEMFAALRERFGWTVELNHDVHEHLTPTNAVALAKALEPFRLFFLEDLLAPEQLGWYRKVSQVCTTPQAVGELFNSPTEWRPLIEERVIDFIRTRVCQIGGITPALKIGHHAEAYGVRTAWQEGGDNDPLNLAAAFHLDMNLWNFGIQEENHFTDEEHEAFPDAPMVDRGYLYPSGRPGLGVDIDEVKAAALADQNRPHQTGYALDFRADGTVVRP